MISDGFAVNLRTRDIRENETIEKLEKYLLEHSADNKKQGKVNDEEYPVLPDYPLSKVQEGIFVECQFNPNSTIFRCF